MVFDQRFFFFSPHGRAIVCAAITAHVFKIHVAKATAMDFARHRNTK